jgi:hypothetical protein
VLTWNGGIRPGAYSVQKKNFQDAIYWMTQNANDHDEHHGSTLLVCTAIEIDCVAVFV